MASLHGGWAPKEGFKEDKQCHSCNVKFTFTTRRHHCRYCMNSFCNSCSPCKRKIPAHGIMTPVRLCFSCRDIVTGQRNGNLEDAQPEDHEYDYDLMVIGGGSGGLACAKEAVLYGAKVALCDFVLPSVKDTTWGVGGTCVNVGCIPKKLMHTAALLGEGSRDAVSYGWTRASPGLHDWETMVKNVQEHIRELNDGYIEQMKDKKITYYNAMGKFVSNHKLQLTDVDGNMTMATARRFVIAVGGRPSYPKIPGVELCLTSDDIFSLKKSPGKDVLVVGASYVALECAGFMHGTGIHTTVMVRSVLLRGFDNECAVKIGEHMESIGVSFLREMTPQKFEEEKDGRIRVTYSPSKGGDEVTRVFDSVLLAVGRAPLTNTLGLCCSGVMRKQDGKIPTLNEQTNVPHIYCLGDAAAPEHSQPLELTPVAVQAGKLLAARLYAGATVQMDYATVPTTVFTPLEYGTIGLTEEEALELLGEDNVEVFHQLFQPLEMKLPNRLKNKCFCKLICDVSEDNRIVGFHFLGPNAGEVTQGFAVAMRLGCRKADLDSTIGIHPTVAETVTTMTIFKGSGSSAEQEDC